MLELDLNPGLLIFFWATALIIFLLSDINISKKHMLEMLYVMF